MNTRITIEDFARIADMPAAAFDLLAANSAVNPFVSATWYGGFERYLLDPGSSALYVVVSVDSRPSLIAPLCVDRRPLLGAVKVRALGNFYTGIYDFCALAGLADDAALLQRVIDALAAWIARELPRLA